MATLISQARRGLALVLAVAAAPGCHSLIYAQVLYGTLVGNVTDVSQASVPRALVKLVNTETGQIRQSASDERGFFAFRDLQQGTYDLTVTASGFSAYGAKDIGVSNNSVVRKDVNLQVGGTAESIVVSASGAGALQTDKADLHADLTSKHVTGLPLSGQRNYQSLLRLVPGITPPQSANSEAGNPARSLVMNVNGTSNSTNNTRIDGAGNNHIWIPAHAAYIPPAEAIETVNVVTNSFDAEQGLAGGAVINVNFKSGTNELHGSVYEYHTNSRMHARNFFYQGAKLPKTLLNQYGFTLGGPVVKNRLFFFGDFEPTRRRESANRLATLPTAPVRSGSFAAAGTNIYDPLTGSPDGSGRSLFTGNQIPANRMDPAALKMLALVPEPNLPGSSNNYFASAAKEFNRDNGDVKINYNPSGKYTLFGRYSIADYYVFDPPSLGAAGGAATGGGQPGSASGRTTSISIGGTITFTPRFLLDGHAGFTRQTQTLTNLDFGKNHGLETLGIPGTNGTDYREGGFPRFNITGFDGYGNTSTSNPAFWRDNQFVYGANFSYTTGAHNLRWGLDVNRQHMNHWQPEVGNYGPRGGFAFTGGITALRGGAASNQFNAFADFLLGLPQNLGRSRQEISPMSTRTWSEALYVRDQWQAARNLTVSYGLRWEYYPFSTRDHRGLERYDPAVNRVLIGGVGATPTDTGVEVTGKSFAPRLGIALRVRSKWVLRAGYGISIDPFPFAKPLRDSYPVVTNSQFQGRSAFEAGGSLRTGIPIIPPVDLGNGVIPIPSEVTTKTLDKVFRRGYVQSFNATIQRELPAGMVGQVSYVGTRAIRQLVLVNVNASAPGAGVGGRALNILHGRTADTSVLTPFRTANYNALQARVDRRFSQGLLLGLSYTFSKTIAYNDNSDNSLPFNWVGALNRNRALTGYDRTHNLQLSGLAELPFGKGKPWASHGWIGRVIGGWQLSGIFSTYSGTPFTVSAPGTSLNAPGNTQTADQVLAEVRKLGGVGRGASYFDPNAFAPVTQVRFGTSGLRILRGPGVVNLDAGLLRTFRVTERWQVQVRADSFNLSNTPHFNNPGADVSTVTRAADGSIRSLGGFTEITSAQDDSRDIRFSLRVSF